MRDKQQCSGLGAGQFQHQREHGIARRFIKVAGWFIRQQHLGARGKGAANGDTLLLPTRKLLGVARQQVRQAQPRGQIGAKARVMHARKPGLKG